MAGSTSRGWRATWLDPGFEPQKSSVVTKNRELDLNSDNRSNEKRHVDSLLLVERRDKSKDFYTSRVIFNQLTWCVCFVGARVCGCVSETVNLKVPAGRGIFFFLAFPPSFSNLHPTERAVRWNCSYLALLEKQSFIYRPLVKGLTALRVQALVTFSNPRSHFEVSLMGVWRNSSPKVEVSTVTSEISTDACVHKSSWVENLILR